MSRDPAFILEEILQTLQQKGSAAIETTNQAFGDMGTGEMAGNTDITRVTANPCKYVKFKASSTNVTGVVIGGENVTQPAGTTTATAGFELLPSEETGWIPVNNTEIFYYRSVAATDDLLFMWLR